VHHLKCFLYSGTHHLGSVKESKLFKAAELVNNQTHKFPAPIINLTTTPDCEEQSDVVILDSFKFEDSLGPMKASENLCKRYRLAFSSEKSPHILYPFALHDTLVLLWDYLLKNGVISLFSHTCLTFVNVGGKTCVPCQELQNNEILKNILTQISEGIHEKSQSCVD
jgi:hypothetical protein